MDCERLLRLVGKELGKEKDDGFRSQSLILTLAGPFNAGVSTPHGVAAGSSGSGQFLDPHDFAVNSGLGKGANLMPSRFESRILRRLSSARGIPQRNNEEKPSLLAVLSRHPLILSILGALLTATPVPFVGSKSLTIELFRTRESNWHKISCLTTLR